MNKKDRDETVRRYEERLLKFGRSIKVMGWRNKAQQSLRFDVLAEVGRLQGRTVLDVGCGFGDLYPFLLKKGIRTQYTGYDLSPNLIKLAREAYPQAQFAVRDILANSGGKKFDYVLSSGVFNHRISNNLKFTQAMIERMFDLAKVGVAVNMMTSYVDYQDGHLYYYSPEQMFTFAQRLSRHVVVRQDYPLYEFTLYIYRKTGKKS
ncbi:MAG: class I SAM-dependent methyltransferase [Candidatus Omnitrophica bacterium]|nr:class I SAM-dependent methyltransferase [Candidatus Omnitrophota bacterium]